jgi:hypothetical protein
MSNATLRHPLAISRITQVPNGDVTSTSSSTNALDVGLRLGLAALVVQGRG